MAELTIGIVTCNRPTVLKKCLQSIKVNINDRIDYHVILYNACLDKTVEIVAKKIVPNIEIVTPDYITGPSAARKTIAKMTETEYLLFLDEDINIQKGTIEVLLNYLENNPEISIASGALKEYGKFRELGQLFVFGEVDNQKYVFKKFITVQEVQKLGLTSVLVHGVMSSMLVRKSIFKKINFDERYKFFYELFDFFMQAYNNNLKIVAIPNAIFYHYPKKYRNKNMRDVPKDEDKKRFIEKWNIIPIGSLGLPIYKSKIYQMRRLLGI